MAKARATRGVWTPPPRSIFQLRIALRYIKPPIWRRVLVRDNWLLGDLHPVLVRVMGWGGYHMHAFRFGAGFKQDQYSTREMVMECGPEMRDEDSVFLGQVIHRKGQVFTYEYDFGDSWLHEVKVEKVLPYDPTVILPVCLQGTLPGSGTVWDIRFSLDGTHGLGWQSRPLSPPCRTRSMHSAGAPRNQRLRPRIVQRYGGDSAAIVEPVQRVYRGAILQR